MHEMSLAESVREIVEDTARRNAATRVSAVRLAIGVLSHVEVEAMRFAFDVVMRGSLAEGARLEVEQPAGGAWCMACSQQVTIAARHDPCPRCGSHQLQVNEGEQMRVLDIEIH